MLNLNDIKAFMEQINSDRKDKALSGGHMTLGNLIDEMYKVEDKSLPVILNYFGEEVMPSEPHSYRGYYEDLSFGLFGPTVNKNTVQIFLDELEECVGYTFEGHKGGEFQMSGDTLVWFSEEGTCSGIYPSGVEVLEDKVFIHTSKETF